MVSAIPPGILRSACAFHEAGHIVVGWCNRRYISHAWLRPPHGISGETCFVPYDRTFRIDRQTDLRRAEVEITILSAGYCGEMIYWNEGEGLKWYPGTISSHEDDLHQMKPYIALLQPSDEAALRARCAAAATAILYRPSMRAAHAAIACRLRDQYRIDRDEVDAVFAREATGEITS